MASDIHALGRLAEPLGGARPVRRVPVRRGRGPARRRPRVPRVVWGLAGTVVILACVGLIAMGSSGPGGEAPTSITAPDGREPGGGAERASRGAVRDGAAATFARIDGLALTLPYARSSLVAFGEGGRTEALALEPLGRLVSNEHPRFEPRGDSAGPEYVVMGSMGRPRSPTSGVDVAVPADAPLTAPVTGTVVRVQEYALPGGGRDFRIVLEPEARPHLHVLFTHVRRPAVTAGDRVEAGVTPVGAARALPGARAVDAYLDEPLASVRIEVKPAGGPEPADPNEDALPLEDPRNLLNQGPPG